MKQIPEKLIEKKVSKILQKRQRNGVVATRESAYTEAKNSLQSEHSRLRFRSRLLISNAVSSFSNFLKWTGISEKKVWDILQLLITGSIPVVIFFGTQNFTKENNKQQQETATQRYQQDTLIKYLEQMSQLLLDKNLRQEDSEARTVARARTLSTLRELDSFRKGLLIKFLAEAQLISTEKSTEKPVISLIDADLSRADLSKADLSRADLSKADLSRANFREADLGGANFREADLQFAKLFEAKLFEANLSGARLLEADLRRADLSGANLSGAKLWRVKLSGADLSGAEAYIIEADFSGADLSGANLSQAALIKAKLIGADLSGANLSKVVFIEADLSGAKLEKANLSEAILDGTKDLSPQQIKLACNWENAVYSEAQFDRNLSQWVVKDKKANQQEIEALKQDKASDPKEPVDCSRW